MKRVSMTTLETLAFGKRRPIEIDEAEGIAVLTVGGQTYYATLPASGGVYRDVVDATDSGLS